ncbi:helix-turn-helix domain-containing protein [Arthrobacter crystallopoietes]|uniref:helix-turn-helix domain-containing protein n=1 Tax=Crystallibacter crystallopoietes TaxID=37928 RepID=UPI001111343D|nr:helix-turn-helix transcriptional regulator [Arthrobacter crystallopoietes]
MTDGYSITWNIRQLMAAKGLFHTTDMVPLLAERGIKLSREQVYRLVTSTPARLNLEVLAAFCDILGCTPNDLISFTARNAEKPSDQTASGETPGPRRIGDLRPLPATIRRPGQ